MRLAKPQTKSEKDFEVAFWAGMFLALVACGFIVDWMANRQEFEAQKGFFEILFAIVFMFSTGVLAKAIIALFTRVDEEAEIN